MSSNTNIILVRWGRLKFHMIFKVGFSISEKKKTVDWEYIDSELF